MEENAITFKRIPSELLATLEKRFTPKQLYESVAYSVVVYKVTEEEINKIPFPEMRKFLEDNTHTNDLLIVCEKKHPVEASYSGEKYYTTFSGDVGGVIRCFETGNIHFYEKFSNPVYSGAYPFTDFSDIRLLCCWKRCCRSLTIVASQLFVAHFCRFYNHIPIKN